MCFVSWPRSRLLLLVVLVKNDGTKIKTCEGAVERCRVVSSFAHDLSPQRWLWRLLFFPCNVIDVVFVLFAFGGIFCWGSRHITKFLFIILFKFKKLFNGFLKSKYETLSLN